ncbi:MAG: UvrD-helicase domain-containing protein [Acidobacteria bacterium]|nr:UvrD-helicase domain-containing protein [Acidobacteriota bacterium]
MSRRAATVLDRNLVVTAGAGTGKTALLVERTLNLLAGPLAQPVDSLALITFTDKAAAELRQRLASALDELRALGAAGEPLPSAPAKRTEAQRAWAWLRGEAGVAAASIDSRARAALAELDGATVSTIHAFCTEILRRHPREAGVDPSFQIDEGASSDQIFEEEWESFLLEELRMESRRADLWRRALLLPGALDSVRSLARSLASFALPAMPLGPPVPAPLRDLFGDEAGAIRDRALQFVAKAAPMNRNMKDFLSATADLLNAFLKRGPEEMRLVTSPLSLDDYLKKKKIEPGAKLDPAEAAEASDIKRRGEALVALLARIDEPRVALLLEAAAPLAARARERLLATGLVTYDALLRLARNLIAENVPVRRALAARWRTILVDEFQDTDPLQYEILFFLCEEESTAARDAYAARLAPGRLFIVGDPKQSIYRFRGADIEAFQRAVGRVIECGGERLSLSVSYRSPAAILDPVNRIFSEWIGPRAGGEEAYEPEYEPIESAREDETAGGDPCVEIWSVPVEGSADDRRRGEAQAIASWISAAAGKKAATGTPLRFRDIAILFRALTPAPLYTQAMRNAGIPFVVEGGRDFYVRQEIGDLVSFLRAAVNPNDGASVLAVMRSPLGGVTDVELARYASAGGRLDRPDLSKAAACPGRRPKNSRGAGFRSRRR